MTNLKGKLVVVPEGWVVVPEDPTEEQCDAWWRQHYDRPEDDYRAMVEAAPPLPDTPPVLRWEGNRLKFYNVTLIRTIHTLDGWSYEVSAMTCGSLHDTEQEARRAAEKALGFPDGLIIPVLD